jgi:hypothetical protein
MYPYFDVVVELVWSHDPKSYAGGSVSYLVGPPMPDRSHSKKLIVTKVEQRKKLNGFNDDGESW